MSRSAPRTLELRAVDGLGGRDAAGLLRRVTRLFVLDRVHRHAAWYLTERLVTADQVRALDDEIDRACAELLPHVETLTDAFGIPTDLLGAPIASEDYIAAWDLRSDELRLAGESRESPPRDLVA